MLVVMISNFHTHFKETVPAVSLDDAAERVAADLRVRAHDRHLVGGERAGFTEDGVRNAHLSMS